MIWPGLRLLADGKISTEKIAPRRLPASFEPPGLRLVANIDWPSKPGLSVAQQKAELISLMDRAAQLHFNAVFFQVRPVKDAFYARPLSRGRNISPARKAARRSRFTIPWPLP